jgi:hypothetical protein
LGGDLESRTVCRPEETIFRAEIWRAESQTDGHPRPACGGAEHEMNAKQNMELAELDALLPTILDRAFKGEL